MPDPAPIVAPMDPAPLAPNLTQPARLFPTLRAEGLVGISDRVLAEHLALYGKECGELAELDAARPRSAWRMPSDLGLLPGQAWQLLNTPIRDLDRTITGPLAVAIERVYAELAARGIAWRPNIVVGDESFWTSDQATTINVPWTLANEVLWRMVNDHGDRYTFDDVVRIMRHEIGHALGYAFELWREGYWRQTFGNFFQPYLDDYPIDPNSRDYVLNLHMVTLGSDPHYAQKHPDEDWAETFAVWLDPESRWRDVYAEWPGALLKLQTVEDLIVGQGRTSGIAQNTRWGRAAPPSTETVAEFLGVDGTNLGDLVLRRTSALRNAVALHELYFEGLARGVGDLGALEQFRRAVASDFGSYETWANDMRACVAAADGWALCCYDQRERRVRNFVVDGHDRGVPAGAAVLIAIDCWEHAYVGDVGIARYSYAAAVFKNICWPVVESRLMMARAAADGNLAAFEPQIILSPVPLISAAPAAPQPWGVLYAAPNTDGSRKSCSNCVLFGGADSCAIHGVPVTGEMVCGYHVNGTPAAAKLRLPVVPVDPALSGLEVVPGGTSCGICKFFVALEPGISAGDCLGVSSDPATFKPLRVVAMACCSRWEPAPAPPAVNPTIEPVAAVPEPSAA